jgi:hypothetical protein
MFKRIARILGMAALLPLGGWAEPPGVTAAKPAAPGVNLLGAGADFEVGPQGWHAFCAYGWEDWTAPGIQPESDATTAHQGQYSLKLTVEDRKVKQGRDNYNALRFMPVKLDPNVAYTFSAWMKTDLPELKVIQGSGEFLNDGYSQTVTVTPEWRRYAFTFRPQNGKRLNYHLPMIMVDNQATRGRLWIDDAQLEVGDRAGAYQAAALEFGAAFDAMYKLFTVAELPATFCRIRFRNNTARPHRFQVHYTIKDYWDKTVATGTLAAEVAGNGNREEKLPLPVLPCGYYRIFFDDPQANLHDEAIFGVYQPVSPRVKLPADWPLGSHASDGNPLVRDLGFGWARCFYTFSFNRVLPAKGQTNFVETDRVVKRCRQAGLNLMPILGPAFNDTTDSYTKGIPDWAVERTPPSQVSWSWTPRVMFPRIEDWKTYVRTLVSRYKHDIKYWEVMNEPNAWLTPEEYVPYLRATYEAAKEADPDCKIVGGGATSDMGGQPAPWTCKVLELDQARHLDVLSIHMYSNTMPETSLRSGTDKVLAFLRNELKKYGRDIPVWHTEKTYTTPVSGYTRKKLDLPGSYLRDPAFQVPDLRAKADYLLRETLIDSAVGHGPFFWFGHLPNDNNISTRIDVYSFHDVEFDLSPGPELLAANGLARMLDGRGTPRRLLQLGPTRYCALFDGPKGALAALWDITGKSSLALPPFPRPFVVANFFGVPLGSNVRRLDLDTSPVYVSADGASAAALAEWLSACRDPASRFEISGGLEPDAGGGVRLSAYVLSHEDAPGDFTMELKRLPAGWAAARRQAVASGQPGQFVRVDFPLSTIAPSAGACEFEILGPDEKRSVLAFPPVPSIAWLRGVLSPSENAVGAKVAEGAITVDGSLNEWSADGVCGAATAEKVKLGREFWRGPLDLSAAVRFRWDRNCLYLAAEVSDDVFARHQPKELAYDSDGLEFFLTPDPKSGPKASSGFRQFLLAPGAISGNQTAATAYCCQLKDEAGVRIASRPVKGGYVLEAAIPWNALSPGFIPAPGRSLGMTFQLCDADAPNEAARKKIFWAGDEDNFQSAAGWGRLVLK